jgi:SAM-dependent methyltransferase
MPADAAEPLAESASLAWKLAREHCEDCSWNHGVWQTLRLLDLIAAPVHHADLYRRALEPLAGRPRILVAAAADYGMLAQVLAAFFGSRAAPQVAVADICETPLALSRWFAARLGVQIETRRIDILEFAAAAPYDAVCTHSFLGQFAPAARARLVANWHRALRPGGRVATVNRLRPGAASEPRIGFSPAQAQGFVRNVMEAAAGRSLPMDAAALEQAATRYAARQGAWPIASLEELRQLFEQAGFAIEHLSSAPVRGVARQQAVSGPTTPGAAQYAWIIATRR